MRTSRALKYQETKSDILFFCNRKTILFASWRLSRGVCEVQEGSKEALEELQDLKRKGSQNGTKIFLFLN